MESVAVENETTGALIGRSLSPMCAPGHHWLVTGCSVFVADCLYGEKIMASSNINMEGTKLMEKVTLTVTFRKQTRVRLAIAAWLLILANWIAPYEVVQVDKE